MISLETLLGQVSQAVQTAGGAVRETECKQFLDWFRTGEDGGLSPKSATFRLGAEGEAVEVPLVTLVNHNALGLAGVRLSMNITAKDEDGRLLVGVDRPEEGDALSHRLELEFGKVSPAEGAARIVDRENQFL